MGCRRVADPAELVRCSVDTRGELHVGPGPGRGAWLCRPPDGLACLDAAERRHALERALRAPLDRASVERLRAKLAALNG